MATVRSHAGKTIDLNKWLKRSYVIERLDPLVKKLRGKAARVRPGPDSSAIVGYNTSYALKVHEDLNMPHPRGGQAKYLTAAVYPNTDKMLDEIAKFLGLRKKATLAQGLLKGADFLLKKSLPLVPVDTRRLKMSGFVTLES